MEIEIRRRQIDRMAGEQRAMALATLRMLGQAACGHTIDALAMGADKMNCFIHASTCTRLSGALRAAAIIEPGYPVRFKLNIYPVKSLSC